MIKRLNAYSRTNIVDDIFCRIAGAKHSSNAKFAELFLIFSRNNSSSCQQYIVLSIFFETFPDLWKKGHMSTGKNADGNHIYIFLNRAPNNSVDALAEAHFETEEAPEIMRSTK